ncbi:hypothetical protein ASD99_01115 [Mesorhizobium sp. Root695]|nr:hypothetical protein ASD12_12185 [Mesorhizobium sp. Root102]KRB34261.1 hypothetical protein ASD99_01115 [Mesorhizobium sp. Root695]
MSHSDFYFIPVYLCGMDRMVAGTLMWAEGETAGQHGNLACAEGFERSCKRIAVATGEIDDFGKRLRSVRMREAPDVPDRQDQCTPPSRWRVQGAAAGERPYR